MNRDASTGMCLHLFIEKVWLFQNNLLPLQPIIKQFGYNKPEL